MIWDFKLYACERKMNKKSLNIEFKRSTAGNERKHIYASSLIPITTMIQEAEHCGSKRRPACFLQRNLGRQVGRVSQLERTVCQY